MFTVSKRRAIVALFVLGFASACQAAIIQTGPAIPLQDLIDGTATISSGDKTFSSFDYNFTGDNPIAADVNVIPITETNGNHYGIRFQGGFIDLAGGGASDALITYKVMAPQPWIIGAELIANATVSGTGVVQIAETFLPDFSDIGMDVFANGSIQQLTDAVMLSQSANYTGPVMMLPVQKDIFLLADNANGVAASVSFVDQLYHQVPEPNSFGLMLLGLVGLVARRRK